ncbi:hypothetical protein [Mucilaginibacter aquatilis]|uniref:Uncharacterized protein n=1 Tax=Mucilaginibacter aquatilis TaxID=1517760 RepID=A0A6I4IC45_9SPHI|nr:hypothetical protein [Mucilaginibacter aquatilis]MVN92487.1 hypothetical protein [Mucilaginibacter aquatilis]
MANHESDKKPIKGAEENEESLKTDEPISERDEVKKAEDRTRKIHEDKEKDSKQLED